MSTLFLVSAWSCVHMGAAAYLVVEVLDSLRPSQRMNDLKTNWYITFVGVKVNLEYIVLRFSIKSLYP